MKGAWRTVATITGIVLVSPVAGQDFSLNYERLSSLEEPVAVEVGDVTLVLNGVLDGALTHDAKEEDTDSGMIGNFQLRALTQLPNRLRVGLGYFGQYVTDDLADSAMDDGYTDNVALSAGGVWGTFVGGNVSGVVREQTRRVRGAGNAELAFDGALGTLADESGGYVGRFGPWIVGSVVDDNGDFEFGTMYQRPYGNKDYRLALRATGGTHLSADGFRRFDTRGAGIVGEFIYGSSTFDAGIGAERFLSVGPDIERWYLSTGARTKTGSLTVSLEGHFGRIESDEEASAALGLQHDLARGLSLNFGLNYARSRAAAGGVQFMDTDETEAIVSLRYSF